MTANRAGIRLTLEDGSDLASAINPRLIGLSLTESREQEADEIQLNLTNHDGLLQIPPTGRLLSLAMGWLSHDEGIPGLIDKGSFTVDEVSEAGPPDKVTITARSANLGGNYRQRQTTSWRDTTLGAILEEIGARHGRGARVASQFAALAIGVIEQEGKSDMAFVRDLGRRYDAVATWKGGYLLFLPVSSSASAAGVSLPALQLTRRDGFGWSFSETDREKYDGAEAQWQDDAAARRRTVTLGGENRRKLKRVYATEAEARQAAQSAMQRGERAGYSFSFDLAIADCGLQVDQPVILSGWNARVDERSWVIASISTSFDGSGLQQKIELEGS